MSKIPIRWRLTIWYAALLATSLFLFGVSFYFVARHEIYDTFNEQLRGQAALEMAAILVDGNHISIEPNALTSFEDDDQFVRLYGSDGEVQVDTSASLGGAPIESSNVESALNGTTSKTWFDSDGGKFGVITSPIKNGNEVVGVLQTGVSRQDADDLLRILAIALAVAAPLTLLLAIGGGYALAGRALEPVATITAMAARIGADDLHARLALGLPDDELGRLANTFDAMLGRIDSAFERQRRFTADAAHELRTPLSLLKSQVDLALSRPRTTEEYQDALRAIESDLGRMTGLVSTLLSLARTDNGKLTLDLAEVDLAMIVRPVLEQYRPLAAEAQITLIDESKTSVLEADEDLLIQIFVNLLDNALAHTPAGGTIKVGCDTRSTGVRIWVEDNGIGISAEHRQHVFEPFYRVDAGRSRDRGGAGLGLAICKAIVEAHGGDISIMSQIDRGTQFEIVLPKNHNEIPFHRIFMQGP
jgi:heavy metal sensor kinase